MFEKIFSEFKLTKTDQLANRNQFLEKKLERGKRTPEEDETKDPKSIYFTVFEQQYLQD